MNRLKLLLVGWYFLVAFCLGENYTNIKVPLLKEVLKKIKQKNKPVSYFQADFKEISSLGLRQGKIYIKKPYQIKIEYYQNGRKKTEIFTDSSKLIIHFINTKIVYEQELNLDLKEQKNSLSNLKKIGSTFIAFDYLEKNYNFNFYHSSKLVQLFDKEEMKQFNLPRSTEIKSYHFLLTPKDITRQLDTIQLWFSKEGKLIRNHSQNVKKEIHDIYFYNLSEESIPNQFFEFITPADVRLIQNILPQF